ncbi:FAD-dependent monooxygenase [Synechococcus sp. M16CYN]|uniref:FAD-dependent monooxygenase n=1 Tax=Synechococcus sp. M16CYN TaxID=3103139 RepID=UPI0030E1151C
MGAGPTGSLAALLLAHQNRCVVLYDPQSPETLQARSRAYAITHSSRRLLSQLGLWDALQDHLIAFERLDLRDLTLGHQVLFLNDDLALRNRGHRAIGWILDHRPLMDMLFGRLQQAALVQLHLGGSTPPAPGQNSLVVAADGPLSPTRESWGIRCWFNRYHQGCLTAKVVLRGAKSNQACELFRPEGPLAILPLGKNNFQIVWSAPMHRCQERSALPSSTFLDQLASVLPPGMEPDLLLDQPKAFTQQWMLAHRLSHGRGVLIGEAGHRCHPVGGQGLNLCWRDVDVLMRVVKQGGPAAHVAARYGRKRWIDLILVGLATDLLVRVFSNRNWFLMVFRNVLLKLLRNNAGLRQLSLKAMTDGPMQIWRALPD